MEAGRPQVCGDRADPAVRSGVPYPTLLQGAHTAGSVQDLLLVPCIRSLLRKHLRRQVPTASVGFLSSVPRGVKRMRFVLR